jgi:single-strand DNA-binding protein
MNHIVERSWRAFWERGSVNLGESTLLLPSRNTTPPTPRKIVLQCSHMGSVNKVILVGNLGKDAETKFIPSGTSVTNFSLATARRWKDQASGEWKEQTQWHRIVYWRAENVANYLLKGKQVYVEGHLETRSYDDKDGKKVYVTEVVCDHLVLLGSRQDGGSSAPDEYSQQPVSMPRSAGRPSAAASQSAPPAPPEDPSFNQGITDDDVPF